VTNAGTYSLHMVVFQALEIPSGKDTQTALDRTKSAISAKIDKRSTTSAPMSSIRTPESDYFKYTPSMQAGPQPGAAERLIKMHNVQNDPLEPPKFRHKKVGALILYMLQLVVNFSHFFRSRVVQEHLLCL